MPRRPAYTKVELSWILKLLAQTRLERSLLELLILGTGDSRRKTYVPWKIFMTHGQRTQKADDRQQITAGSERDFSSTSADARCAHTIPVLSYSRTPDKQGLISPMDQCSTGRWFVNRCRDFPGGNSNAALQSPGLKSISHAGIMIKK